ncbi:hypothetical protein FB567DRAFT_455258 [Paraphoma chrysanthemicola]|uniref:Uncharacterized protein n=1 Tax=Paraphoma chrysanthemicola TaxID=798071 RepID=A0A8K0VTI9_9PLEO|nr:hypothetical protein FB567DRAFT_455258 [Paraphoma chrysanthemicola]
MDKNGRWTVKLQVWRTDKDAHVDWTLLDSNGNEAGKGSAASSNKADVQFYVESKYRPLEHMMPYGVNGFLTGWTKFDDTRVKFEIQKEMVGCPLINTRGVWLIPDPCKPYMWTENRLESKMFEVNTCWQNCKNEQDRKLLPSDMNCNDLNDADWYDRDGKQHRDFECYWKGF